MTSEHIIPGCCDTRSQILMQVKTIMKRTGQQNDHTNMIRQIQGCFKFGK